MIGHVMERGESCDRSWGSHVIGHVMERGSNVITCLHKPLLCVWSY